MTMDDTLQINDAEEANELLRRATDAKFQAQATLRSLTAELGTARQSLAMAISAWQRGIQITPEQLQRQHVEQQHQRRVTDPKWSAAAQYARRTMAVGNIKGSKHSGPVAGMTKTQLMTKQIRERGEALPFSWKATPDAPPGSAD
jgi:hypothetical protein